MKQQSLLPETGGQKEAFERLKAGRITLRYPFPASGPRWMLITLCYAHSSFQPSSWVEQIHFQYLLKAFQLLHTVRPAHCKILTSILSLHPLNVIFTPTSVVTNKSISRHYPLSWRDEITLQWKPFLMELQLLCLLPSGTPEAESMITFPGLSLDRILCVRLRTWPRTYIKEQQTSDFSDKHSHWGVCFVLFLEQ